MKFIRVAQTYIRIFYLMGHCRYPLSGLLNQFQEKETWANRLKFLTPAIITGILEYVMCIYNIFLMTILESPDQSSKIITLFFCLCQVLRISFVLYQSITLNNHLRQIIEIFHTIERFFRNDLNMAPAYGKLHRNLRNKVFLLIFAYLQAIMLFLLQPIEEIRMRIVGLMVRIILLMSTVSFFHIVFYADLLAFNLKHLNAVIVRDTELYTRSNLNVFVLAKQKYGKIAYDNLRKYKFVHYRLWQVSRVNGSVVW